MSTDWRFALLGEKLSYTKSPDIFAAIGESLNQDIRFEIQDLSKQRLPEALYRLRERQIDGLSVTIPHKESVCSFVDRCSPEAETIGAVNCVVSDQGKLTGHNTDWEGFMEPLMSLAGRLTGGRVLIFGSGGSARAAIFALRNCIPVKEFVVVSRGLNRCAAVEMAAGEVTVRVLTFDQLSQETGILDSCSLIVNATPLGGSNHPDGGMLQTVLAGSHAATYYDLNYNDNNLLIQKAGEVGDTVISGKRMLVAQALKSFTLWTGVEVPFEPIYQKVFGPTNRQA